MTKTPKVIDKALLDSDKEIEGITIHTLTIARYSLLELLDSPFVNSKEQFSLMSTIPSLYVMAVDAEDLVKYDVDNIDELKKDAVVWSEKLNPEFVGKAITDIIDRVKTAFKLAPEDIDEPGSKKK